MSGARDYTEAKRMLTAGRTDEALVHAVLALVAATAESGRLTTRSTSPGVKPSEWWTALHGEERS